MNVSGHGRRLLPRHRHRGACPCAASGRIPTRDRRARARAGGEEEAERGGTAPAATKKGSRRRQGRTGEARSPEEGRQEGEAARSHRHRERAGQVQKTTIVTPDKMGTCSWASAGSAGFKGCARARSRAQTAARENAARKHGVRPQAIRFLAAPGCGPRRRHRSLQAVGSRSARSVRHPIPTDAASQARRV